MEGNNKHFEKLRHTYSPDDFLNTIYAINSIKNEHAKPTVISFLKENYTFEEIMSAFDPSILSFENKTLTEEDAKKRVEILNSYYELDLTLSIKKLNLIEDYDYKNSPYELASYSSEDIELDSSLEDEEEEGLTYLERLIIKKQDEFLRYNSEQIANELGFDFEKYVNKCMASGLDRDTCLNRVENIYIHFLNFVKREVAKINPNFDINFHDVYEKFMPLKGFDMYKASFEPFDIRLMKINPSEYEQIIHLIRDLLKHDEKLKKYKSWFEFFREEVKNDEIKGDN